MDLWENGRHVFKARVGTDPGRDAGLEQAGEKTTMDTTAQIPFVERRTRNRRRHTRRVHDRNHVNERRQMAVVVYLVMALVAGAAFAVGMGLGWFMWGTPWR